MVRMAMPASAVQEPLQFVLSYAFRRADPETGALVGLLADSVLGAHLDATVVLLCNEPGLRSNLPPSVSVRVSEMDTDHVMVERLRLFRDHLRDVPAGTTVVFMDTDMLLVRRIDRMLAADADVCVTVRRDRNWPINAGIIAVRTEHHRQVVRLFDALLDCCHRLPDAERRWYGDQVALAQVLEPEIGRFRDEYDARRTDCRVRFVPSRTFNYTPRPWMLRFCLFAPGARVLHFKGDRKARMPAYARRYLGPFRRTLLRRLGRA